MLDIDGCLPKNLNGIRTTHTCELCGFEPKTKNKYREKQDHLVMKHFKERIEKIFPQSRPYTCPAEGCTFSGKDKQALLRHYTGKHGILEKYLREALAENGIQYLPTEQGTKRRCSVSLTPSAKMARQGMMVTIGSTGSVSVDPKDLLPKQPLPMAPRQNTEELRREVEALMASFQPAAAADLGRPVIINVSVDQHKTQFQQSQLQSRREVCQTSKRPIKIIELPSLPELCSTPGDNLDLPNSVSPEPDQIDCFSSPHFDLTPPLSQSTLSSLMGDDDDDDLSMTPSLPMAPLPLDLITTHTDLMASPEGHTIYLSAVTSPSLFSSSPVLDNKEVMWGSGPAVIVEASDTIPITYIETVDGNYAAMLDAIDCDLLMPSINSLDPIKERQLDFCTY